MIKLIHAGEIHGTMDSSLATRTRRNQYGAAGALAYARRRNDSSHYSGPLRGGVKRVAQLLEI